MRLSVALLAFVAAGGLLIAACGGDGSEASDPTAAPELTQEDRTYRDQVRVAFRGSDVNFQMFEAALARSFSSPGAILSALVEAGAGTTFDPVLERLEELEPTERFAADHEIFVQSVRAMVAADQGIGAAAADDDIVSFELGNVELFLAQIAMRFELSAEACRFVSDLNEFCEPDRELPGGEYGAELHEVMRTFAAEFNPRVGVLNEGPGGVFLALTFVPLYTAEEVADLYGAVEAEIMAALADAMSAVDNLEPPDEFKADHELLLTWLEETSGISGALFQATGEDDRNERGSLQEQGRIAFCAVIADLSLQAFPLVSVVFENPPVGDDPENPPCA
jgi:hypothetical protein